MIDLMWALVACVVVPVAAALLASPELRAWLRGKGSVEQTFSNAGTGLVFLVTQLGLRGALLAVFARVSYVVPWKIPDRPLGYLAAFVLLDFVYYLQHRLEHRVPLLWAVHAVHHQSHDYNLSVSLRVGALSSVSTLGFHLLLALIGVSLPQYAIVVAVHAALLFTLHARTKFHVGPGRLFNAPVFHRVHHGAEAAYIDKNFGGVFLVFDRIFGTFAPYGAEPTFGVVGEESPLDPLRANVTPLAALVEKVRARPTLRQKLSVLFVR
jgi:sterol desaturase/sphingolipid hydroxylase (fatty acid hydroxylase superfamily)